MEGLYKVLTIEERFIINERRVKTYIIDVKLSDLVKVEVVVVKVILVVNTLKV